MVRGNDCGFVAYRPMPNARIYFFTLHFDADGIEIFVGLPDDTVLSC